MTEIVVTQEWRNYHALNSVFEHGKDYYLSYKVIVERNQREQDYIKKAHIVNLVFSLELLLKALHHGEGRSERGHNLKKLFNRLSGKIKKQVQELVFKKLPAYKRKDTGFPTFEDLLSEHATAFEKWRYFYETGWGSFNFQFCETLASSIIEVGEQMLSDLKMKIEAQVKSGKIILPIGLSAEPIKLPKADFFKRLFRGFRYSYLAFNDGFKER